MIHFVMRSETFLVVYEEMLLISYCDSPVLKSALILMYFRNQFEGEREREHEHIAGRT